MADRRARGRSKTKDPNDLPEPAAPVRGRRGSKDPNDVPEVAAPAAPVHFGQAAKPLLKTQSERSDEAPALNDDFLYRRYRSPRGKKNRESDILDTLSEPSGSHHSEAEEGESPDMSLRSLGRTKTLDFSGLMHRFSALPEPKFDSEEEPQDVVIEDVGSGEDAEALRGPADGSQDLEVTALPGSMTAIGADEPRDPFVAVAPQKKLKPALKSQASTVSTASKMSMNSAYTWGSEDDENLKRAPSSFIEGDDLDGLVEVNTAGKLCLLTFMYYWAMMSGGVLVALAWRYMWRHTDALAYLAMQSAAKHARVQFAEVMEPAIATMRMLDLAFRRGAVTSRVDVVGIHRVLAPLFLLQPTLLEVEVVDPPELPPENGRSSLLVSRAQGEGNLMELKTRWEDCLLTGCGSSTNSTDPPSAYGEGSWYETGRTFTVPSHYGTAPYGSWLSPCVGNCESASLSWVGRIAGGHGAASSPRHTLVGRATVDLHDFISATRRAASIGGDGKGSPAVMLCTHLGRVMTGINHEGSAAPVTMPEIWTMDEIWARGADRAFVNAGTGEAKRIEGFSVTSWKLESLIGPKDHADYASDWHLRLVLAAPDSVFEDPFLGPLYIPTFAVSVVPMITAAILVLLTLCRLCEKRYKKSKILAAATTLRNNIDSSESKKAVKDAMEAFEFEAALNRTGFQDDDTPVQTRRAQRQSIVLGGLFGKNSTKRNTMTPTRSKRPASAGLALDKWMGRKQTISPQASGKALAGKALALQDKARRQSSEQRDDPMGLALEVRK